LLKLARRLISVELPATITSKTNARVKALRAAFSGDARNPGDLVALEGETAIAEALQSVLRLHTVFLREGSERMLERIALLGIESATVVVLSPEVFNSAVETVSPQGIAALLPIPAMTLPPLGEGVALIVEDLQDPGNLGTLLRAAEAFGITRVWATLATVNTWSPKTMRASAGSVFRVPVGRGTLAEIATACRSEGVRLIAATAQSAKAIPLTQTDLSAPCALLVGNEGAGLSAEALRLADACVHIPCAIESLNVAVAGAVLMYEAMAQRMRAASQVRP
jgi:TrmH family RNA methyltransferase